LPWIGRDSGFAILIRESVKAFITTAKAPGWVTVEKTIDDLAALLSIGDAFPTTTKRVKLRGLVSIPSARNF
jgi:hypothetical protein